jgi:outer membrane receptor protein involved in Fe transport
MRRYLTAVLLGLAATPVSAQPAPPTTPAAPPTTPAAPPTTPAAPPTTPAAPPTMPDSPGPSDAELLDSAQGSEVISVESKSLGQVLRESARAVTVVDTKVAKKRASDLGEVLSRTHGVQVRRDGGLGSFARFSLNGLYDDQVRFFLDGVPLELAGWGVGIANVPVDLLERVDIHRGVVPIALGADALGGAIDLITDPSWVSRATASLEIGSFGTNRGSVTGRARDADTGLALSLSAFADRALNNYPIRVEVPDEQGRLQEASVRRFHDGYLAAGGNAELGIVDRGPVRRALVRLFASQYNKDLQHNLVMTVPYGKAGYGEAARGATGDITLEHGPWHLRVLGGGTHRRIDYHDIATKVYDWFGNEVRDRQTIGEVDSLPTYQVVTENSVFARIVGDRALGDHHRLRVAVAPTGTFRGGEDLILTVRGPIDAKRNLTKLVSGVEHEWRTDDSAIQNVAFVKHYAMWTDADDVQTGNVFVPIKQRIQRFGAGDGVRWRALSWLSFKASYEYATRLPSVDELFGDGKLIDANLHLEPEVSHNGNLEVAIEHEGRYGAISAQADVFVREADRLILMIGDDRRFINQNVWKARIRGIEGGGKWSLPGERGWVEGSITLQDLRNASSEGLFGAYEGDRIPNRPWLLGSLGATARARDLVRRDDELLVFANSRYVHEFFRGWESLGRRDSKQVIPSQLVHSAGVTYLLHGDGAYSGTIEVQNLTDTSAYDSYGVVRPGRGLYLKLGVEF